MITMRFYGGLQLEEMAEYYGCSTSSIKRRLRTAQAFLKTTMQ